MLSACESYRFRGVLQGTAFVKGRAARLLTSLVLLALILQTVPASGRAVSAEILELSEPIDRERTVAREPRRGVVFDFGFARPPDRNGDDVHDYFRAHSYWDWKEIPRSYNHSVGGGVQTLQVMVGGQLEDGRPSGDVGVHKTFHRIRARAYRAQAWVDLDSYQRTDPREFKARLTIHALTRGGRLIRECNAAYQENEPSVRFVRLTISYCAIPGYARKVRANIRANARPLAFTRAAAGWGVVRVDRFRFVRLS